MCRRARTNARWHGPDGFSLDPPRLPAPSVEPQEQFVLSFPMWFLRLLRRFAVDSLFPSSHLVSLLTCQRLIYWFSWSGADSRHQRKRRREGAPMPCGSNERALVSLNYFLFARSSLRTAEHGEEGEFRSSEKKTNEKRNAAAPE